MKVRELIECLRGMDPHADVGIEVACGQGTRAETHVVEIGSVEWPAPSLVHPVALIPENQLTFVNPQLR